MPMPMDYVSDFASSTLEEGGSAEPRAVALYCLLFHARDTALDRDVGDYVLTHRDVLDEVFGPRLQGFAIEKLRDGEAKDARDEIYRYARLYGVGANRLPCAVFLTGFDNRKALRLPFDAFLPPKAKRESDDIALAFRAIATAADETSNTSEWHRLASFQRSLRTARRNAYGDRIPLGSRSLRRVACDADAINRIATSGKSLLTLAAATAAIFGGPAALSGATSAVPAGHAAVTRSVDGPGAQLVNHEHHTPSRAPK